MRARITTPLQPDELLRYFLSNPEDEFCNVSRVFEIDSMDFPSDVELSRKRETTDSNDSLSSRKYRGISALTPAAVLSS